MKDINDLMMESFVEIVDELAESRGFKKNEFAGQVWPESSPRAASSRWQNMRTKVSNTGKPQGVLISDAQRMAGVLGMDIAYLFLQASERARKKEAATNHIDGIGTRKQRR